MSIFYTLPSWSSPRRCHGSPLGQSWECLRQRYLCPTASVHLPEGPNTRMARNLVAPKKRPGLTLALYSFFAAFNILSSAGVATNI